MLMALMTPTAPSISTYEESPSSVIESISNSAYLAEAGGSGNQYTSLQYMSRDIAGNILTIQNSYTDTAHHNGTLDLSDYHIPGWTLYQVDITCNNIIGVLEREVVGVQDQTQNFYIREIGGVSNITQLAQAF